MSALPVLDVMSLGALFFGIMSENRFRTPMQEANGLLSKETNVLPKMSPRNTFHVSKRLCILELWSDIPYMSSKTLNKPGTAQVGVIFKAQ